MSVRTVHAFEKTPDGLEDLELKSLMKDLIHPNRPEGVRKYMDALKRAVVCDDGRLQKPHGFSSTTSPHPQDAEFSLQAKEVQEQQNLQAKTDVASKALATVGR